MTDIPNTTRAVTEDGIVYRQTIGDTAIELTLYQPDDAGFAVVTAELDHHAGTGTIHIEFGSEMLRWLGDDAVDMADRLERD